MNTNVQSKNISLIFDYGLAGPRSPLDDLWTTLRRTAVEPGQASSPAFASFADECLLCAQIVTNGKVSSEEPRDDDNASIWDARRPGSSAHAPPATSMQPFPPPPPESRRAGLVYLHVGPANLPAGEANIGVIMKPGMRCRGYAHEAVQLVLRWAFEELKFHRVQAAILDTPFKDRALRLFVGSGFSHEGTKRRAVYQREGEGTAGVWKDVTYLAMLDTEWMLRSTSKGKGPEQPVMTAWDEMFARHWREQEELLRWEERHGRVRRSPSTETVRENAQDLTCLTEDWSSLGHQSVDGSMPPSPKPGPNVFVTLDEDELMTNPLGDDLSKRWEEVEVALEARRRRQDIMMSGSLLQASPLGRLLALPSIPSMISEGNSQSPLTIPSPSTEVSIPPPSPARSSTHDSRSDALDDTCSSVPIPHDPCRAGSSRTRSRSDSSSASSTDSWTDAQSSVDASSNNWDVISDTSPPSHHKSF